MDCCCHTKRWHCGWYTWHCFGDDWEYLTNCDERFCDANSGLYNDDFVTCLGTATDPDETPSLSYEWSIDGATVGTSDTLLLLLTDAMPFDTLVCTVTADDGTDVDTSSASVLIENRDPIIVASIMTNGTNHNAELTCEVSLQELDGDTTTVSYEWFNGGIALGTANPIQLDSTMASAGDVIFCIPTATDGNGGIGVSNASHMITNTVPVINSVTVTPDPATVGLDDLTCAVSASDADGDSLLYFYQWSDSTGVQQTTTLVSDTTDVPTSGLTEDTWTCSDPMMVPIMELWVQAILQSKTIVSRGDGSRQNCPSLDCATILNDGHSTGDGFYWIDPNIPSAYEVYCLMDSAYDGGGWTLISVHSDDGQDTWTWNNRGYFDTDTTTFGSLSALNEDFKSPALHDVYMHDLLFVHAPSGIWAGYNDIDSSLGNFGSFVGQRAGPNCYQILMVLSCHGSISLPGICVQQDCILMRKIEMVETAQKWRCFMGLDLNVDKGAGCSFETLESVVFRSQSIF